MAMGRRLTTSLATLRGYHPPTDASKSPTLKAYICPSSEHYSIAERTFFIKWQQRQKDLGPWDKLTVLSLNNWIITLIKLKQFEKAEAECRSSLGAMIADSLQGSPQYMCMLCNLASCLFLGGNLADADAFFGEIKSHGVFLQYEPTKGFFEVLSMTVTMRTDCLVLRDSKDGVQNLVDVTDCVTPSAIDNGATNNFVQGQIGAQERNPLLLTPGSGALSGKRENKRARLSAMFRVSSSWQMPSWQMPSSHLLSRSRSVTTRSISRASNLAFTDENAATEPIVGKLDVEPGIVAAFDSNAAHKYRPSPTNLVRTRSQSLLASSLHFSPRNQPVNATPRPALAVQALTSIDEASKIEDWLDHQKLNQPLPETPSLTSTVPLPTQSPFDPSLGYTNRSTETAQTTRTSQLYGTKSLNKLKITAWASGKHIRIPLIAGLDSGSAENCVSEELCSEIGAEIDPTKKRLCSADGSLLNVLGRTKISFSFEGPLGDVIKKVGCFVVRDLSAAMLISERYIVSFKLRDSPGIVATILLASRSRKSKQADAKASQDIADVAKNRKAEQAAQRKAGRDSLDELDKFDFSQPSSKTNSIVGGSETTTESRTSSLPSPSITNTTRSTTS